MAERERRLFYQEKLEWIRQYTAVFVVSDYYAVELMQFLQAQGIRIPEEMAIAGFDDCPICRMVYPPLTTIRQDGARRAQLAVSMLQELKAGNGEGSSITLPVTLVVRQSTG